MRDSFSDILFVAHTMLLLPKKRYIVLQLKAKPLDFTNNICLQKVVFIYLLYKNGFECSVSPWNPINVHYVVYMKL